MRMPATVLALAAIGLSAAACGNDSNAPDTSHVGLYDMVSVDGQPLPATVVDQPGYQIEVTQGSMTLNANNSFVQALTIVETIDGTTVPLAAASCSGSYTRRGSIITLTTPESDSCTGQTVTGTLSGRTLSVDYDGTVAVFSRRP